MEHIGEALREYVTKKCSLYSSEKLLPLMMPTFGPEEILEAFDSMVELNVTMGKKVDLFENMFSNYLGVKHSLMVNSGSSANLLALSILSNPTVKNRIKPGDEIIVPSVTWSTSIFPIINIGAVPVLVDVGEDYLIDIEKLKSAITSKTKAIMPVHLLGNVCSMDEINDVARDHNLFVIEDCCEAMGSEYKGKKVGALSDLSSFSSYFSHHITTMEGGFLCTDNFDFADLARILRAHGYVRHSLRREEYVKKHPEIDPRFLFVNIGYNFRPTDVQAAFGIHQIKRLESFIEKRTKVGRKIRDKLSAYNEYLILPKEKPNTRHSWFVFPITVVDNKYFTRKDLTSHLEAYGIETRPLVCGNFAEQPAMQLFEHRTSDLTHSKNIMRNSFYFGIHPNISDEKINEVISVFDKFFQSVRN